MQLNLDCVRSVLLAVEKLQVIEISPMGNIITRKVSMKAMFGELTDRLPEDIVYSVILLKDEGYIEADIIQTDSVIANFHIHRMTYRGHELLERIRDGKVWSKILNAVSFAAVNSLGAVFEAGGDHLTAALKTFFKNN